VYTGDSTIVGGGTQWYIGDKNAQLYKQFGTDFQVNQAGLEVTETPYEPGAGYINDNTKRKAHGTRVVRPGAVRESVLFTFS
jgi:hypothetical protein